MSPWPELCPYASEACIRRIVFFGAKAVLKTFIKATCSLEATCASRERRKEMAPTPSLIGLLLLLFVLAVAVVYFLPLAFTRNRYFLPIWVIVGLAITYFSWAHLTPPSLIADGVYDAGDSRVRNFLFIQWLFAALAQFVDKFAKRRRINRRWPIIVGTWVLSLAAVLGMIWLVNLVSI